MGEEGKGSKRLLTFSKESAALLLSVTAILTSIYSLSVSMFPSLKPVETSYAAITKVSVDMSVPWWMFYDQYPQAVGRDSVSPRAMEIDLGAVVYVQANLQGSRNKHFAVHGVLHFVGENIPVIDENQEYSGTIVTPTVSDQRVTLVTWIPLPPVGDDSPVRKLYIRAELYQLAVDHGNVSYRREKGTLLDVSDSEPLTWPIG
jgi:hypothetical protein